jgi:hypothetical protein
MNKKKNGRVTILSTFAIFEYFGTPRSAADVLQLPGALVTFSILCFFNFLLIPPGSGGRCAAVAWSISNISSLLKYPSLSMVVAKKKTFSGSGLGSL